MTTIAASRRQMASDSKVTDNDLAYYVKTGKCFVIGESIIGVAGEIHDTNLFLAWFRDGKKPLTSDDIDKFEDGFRALELNRNGLFLYHGCYDPDELAGKFWAIGSGAAAALCAMRRGCSPRVAVAEAAAVDNNTGGKIFAYDLVRSRKGA